MPDTPVRIGVLGAASIARRRMLPAFAAHPATEVVAIASRTPDRAAELTARYGGTPFSRYEDVLRPDNGVDAVYVPLPIALHAHWTERALLSDKHVLAEKPLTDDPAKAVELVRLARDRGLALMENVLFLQHSQHAAAARLLGEGVIGELRAFSAAFAIPPTPETDIRHRPELGGGALLDVGYYPVRAAMHLVGPELEVVGAMTRTCPERLVDTAGGALLRRVLDGVPVQLTWGMEHFYRSCYEYWGSRGRIFVEPAFTPGPDHVPRLRIVADTGAREIVLEPDDQVAATVEVFVQAVRADGVRADVAEATVLQARLLDEIRFRAGDVTADGVR
ncbi:Gfo/Idh/MocA family oxidoreductase [Streptomyces sp. NPDC048417]|uniref:Gfo/Idh/MocA family protein n=1 Tax=Streptomyces sp. NPDC048417 TaxID=3155387 RepID=UPI0034421E32